MNVYMRCFLIVVISATFFTGCDDDDGPKGKYENGVFVVNESQQSIEDYSCGDSSGIEPVFPFNLLML